MTEPIAEPIDTVPFDPDRDGDPRQADPADIVIYVYGDTDQETS